MALFNERIGNDGNKSSDVSEFKSIIVETANVVKELKNVSIANHLTLSELGFKVLKVTTFFSDEKTENNLAGDEEMKLFLDDAFMLNPKLKITQYYRVEIFKQSENAPSIHLPTIALSANKNLTKVVAAVSKSNDVQYTPKLEELMIEDIQIKKIRAGVLLGIRDHNMYKEVKKLVANIHINGIIDQDVSFVVCQGIDDIPSTNDDLIYHYKKKTTVKNADGKVDYSKRGYISAVEKDECLIEYIKPQIGTPGRNCRGVFIPAKEPQKNNDIPIRITSNIVKKENETSIKYIANRGGYVNVEKGNYDIQDQMEINEISFRSTGSIDANITSNIKINIKEKDVLKDAIGAGMSVETSELIVQGNIGSGAKIKAKLVEIGGQTHQSAFIEADKITIAVHRGDAVGQEITIGRLEGGKVMGDKVLIKQMIGGEVVGKTVKIDVLMSNARVTASEMIEIGEIKGSNNKLLIDPSVTKEFNQLIEEIKVKLQKLGEELKAYPRQLSIKKEMIEKNKPMAEMVKAKILELKQSKVEPPMTLYAKIKDFQEKVIEYNTLLQEYKDKKETFHELENELSTVQMKVFSAKVISHSAWKEFNEVRFHLINPPKDITYSPKEHEIIREMSLKDMGNSEYRILRSSEYSGT